MDKLKAVITEYGRWSQLDMYIDRIEAHIEKDFSNSLENAKALLETIGKEICAANQVELNATSNINGVLKSAFSSLGFNKNSLVTQVSSALSTIGQQLGELRNEIGLTSHGKTLEEVRQRNKVDVLTREFLIDTVEVVSIFLIRNFESKQNYSVHEQFTDTLGYGDAEEFNEFWDDSFGDFSMRDYSYSASEILFNLDKKAYMTEFQVFTEEEV